MEKNIFNYFGPPIVHPINQVLINGIVFTRRLLVIASIKNNTINGNDYACDHADQVGNYNYNPNTSTIDQHYALEWSTGKSNKGENFPGTFLPIRHLSPIYFYKASDLFAYGTKQQYLHNYIFNTVLSKVSIPCRENAANHLYFFLKRFGCYKELQISAALGGGIWESNYEEFRQLKTFVLNFDISTNRTTAINEEELKYYKYSFWDTVDGPMGKTTVQISSSTFWFQQRKEPIAACSNTTISLFNVLDCSLSTTNVNSKKITFKELMTEWQTKFKNNNLCGMPYETINAFLKERGITLNDKTIESDIAVYFKAQSDEPKRKKVKTESYFNDTYRFYTDTNEFDWKECNPERNTNTEARFNLSFEELYEQEIKKEKEKLQEEIKTLNEPNRKYLPNQIDLVFTDKNNLPLSYDALTEKDPIIKMMGLGDEGKDSLEDLALYLNQRKKLNMFQPITIRKKT